MRKPARRHHIVPEFYLRGFAADGILSVLNLPGDRGFPQSVHDATVQNRFYSVEGHPDGEDLLERALSSLEGAAAEVFRRVIDDRVWPLRPDDRETLATFVRRSERNCERQPQRWPALLAKLAAQRGYKRWLRSADRR